jgi:hypothetical protein
MCVACGVDAIMRMRMNDIRRPPNVTTRRAGLKFLSKVCRRGYSIDCRSRIGVSFVSTSIQTCEGCTRVVFNLNAAPEIQLPIGTGAMAGSNIINLYVHIVL